tara:strand:- start:132 stop:452 length:321 start_codon:yes stop_codon:yes gene_type:complete
MSLEETKSDSGLGVSALKTRVEKLESDVKNVTTQINDLEKKKIEAVALLNALNGAKQQCQMFLQEINNADKPKGLGLDGLTAKVEPEEDNQLVNTGQENYKDMGTL